MALYKFQPDGRFTALEKAPFDGLERKLEDWIEQNPHILLDDTPLAVIARQPRNLHGKFLDLLAIDPRGTTVVIELKRGEAPREVIAQALEYAAWVDSLTLEQLNEIARDYADRTGFDAAGLADVYVRAFSGDDPDGMGVDPSVVTFNVRQSVVVVAEHFTPELEQTARYLRSRMGLDLRLIRFSVHRAGGETVIEVTTVVGNEPMRGPQTPDDGGSDEAVKAHVTTDFMRSAVGTFDRWVNEQENPAVTIEHPGWNRRVRYRGREQCYFYYAKRWISLWLMNSTSSEIERSRTGLSQPDSIREHPTGFWCRLATPGDLELIKTFLAERIATRKES